MKAIFSSQLIISMFCYRLVLIIFHLNIKHLGKNHNVYSYYKFSMYTVRVISITIDNQIKLTLDPRDLNFVGSVPNWNCFIFIAHQS